MASNNGGSRGLAPPLALGCAELAELRIEIGELEAHPTHLLTPEARIVINQTLKKGRPVDTQDSQDTEEELIGILRAVDLDKDFLDVTVRGDSVHVIGLGDTMDDVIGSIVNKRVKILVVHAARNSIRFRDIELDE